MDRVSLSAEFDISRLVYGMWRLGDDADTSPGHIQAKIEACLAQGLTTMDQADIYGGYEAEALLGACFRAVPGLRDKLEIITKCDIIAPGGRHAQARMKHYDTSRDHIFTSVEHSLSLMAIEQIDLLLIHRPDPLMDPDETGRALDDLVAQGKVRAVGVSNFRPWDWDLLQAAMSSSLVTNQIEMSLIAHEAFTNGDLAHLQKNGVKPMAWSPLGGGGLVDGSRPELSQVLSRIARAQDVDESAVAVAWLLAHPACIAPVMGTNRVSRIANLSKAFDVAMDRQTWFELYTAALGREVA